MSAEQVNKPTGVMISFDQWENFYKPLAKNYSEAIAAKEQAQALTTITINLRIEKNDLNDLDRYNILNSNYRTCTVGCIEAQLVAPMFPHSLKEKLRVQIIEMAEEFISGKYSSDSTNNHRYISTEQIGKSLVEYRQLRRDYIKGRDMIEAKDKALNRRILKIPRWIRWLAGIETPIIKTTNQQQ